MKSEGLRATWEWAILGRPPPSRRLPPRLRCVRVPRVASPAAATTTIIAGAAFTPYASRGSGSTASRPSQATSLCRALDGSDSVRLGSRP